MDNAFLLQDRIAKIKSMSEKTGVMDNAFLLQDRIAKIKSMSEKTGVMDNAYISFSGGKDSTVLHYLFDIALPNNTIPRVFIDTGIEYNSIRNFVKSLAEKDNRFVILKPSQNIKTVLETYGYPFKSKEHSCKLALYKQGSKSEYVKKYANETGRYSCPSKLKYQFDESFSLNVSDRCCYKLKKDPIHKWEKENKKTVAILGVRMGEGGQRANHTECIVLDEKGNVKKFKPLNPVSDEWEEWFIKEYKIELCELYYPPYNFKRTGCKGCPFSLDLEEQLVTMGMFLPAERKQCELIWKPVYEEYRRIGYRLKNNDLWGN